MAPPQEVWSVILPIGSALRQIVAIGTIAPSPSASPLPAGRVLPGLGFRGCTQVSLPTWPSCRSRRHSISAARSGRPLRTRRNIVRASRRYHAPMWKLDLRFQPCMNWVSRPVAANQTIACTWSGMTTKPMQRAACCCSSTLSTPSRIRFGWSWSSNRRRRHTENVTKWAYSRSSMICRRFFIPPLWSTGLPGAIRGAKSERRDLPRLRRPGSNLGHPRFLAQRLPQHPARGSRLQRVADEFLPRAGRAGPDAAIPPAPRRPTWSKRARPVSTGS